MYPSYIIYISFLPVLKFTTVRSIRGADNAEPRYMQPEINLKIHTDVQIVVKPWAGNSGLNGQGYAKRREQMPQINGILMTNYTAERTERNLTFILHNSQIYGDASSFLNVIFFIIYKTY